MQLTYSGHTRQQRLCINRQSVIRCRSIVAQVGGPTVPARTCRDAALQARGALRRYRDALSQGSIDVPQTGPCKTTIVLPFPVPGKSDDGVRAMNEGQWPGGMIQRFRAIRPEIEEALLEGYNPSFAGMLESEADGVGVWAAGDMTVIANVTNATFKPFADLMDGKYGAKVTQAGHVVVAVNPQWTVSKDVGQLWDGRLRKKAAAIIDDGTQWITIYCLRVVTTNKGRAGILFRAYPGDWQIHAVDSGDAQMGEAVQPGQCLKRFKHRPSPEQIKDVLISQPVA